MKNFWQNLVGNELNQLRNQKKQQINISKSSIEALTDALNDNSDEIPDEISDDGQQDPNSADTQQDDMGGDMGDIGGMDDMGGSDDMGGGSDDTGGGDDFSSSGDDFGDSGSEGATSEPEQIKKDEFSLLNGKIELVKRFDLLIDHAISVKEMLEENTTLYSKHLEELESLIEIMDDLKNKVGFKSQAESLIRYRMCYTRLNNILNSFLKEKAK